MDPDAEVNCAYPGLSPPRAFISYPLSTGRWKGSARAHVNILFLLLRFVSVTLPPDYVLNTVYLPLEDRPRPRAGSRIMQMQAQGSTSRPFGSRVHPQTGPVKVSAI